MELSQLSNIQALVKDVKEGMLSNIDPYSFVSPSAYDTAWLALIADSEQPSRPMFKNCLNWVHNNQNEEGFWGECDGHGRPTIASLPATLACIIALKRWNYGRNQIIKGLEFVHANLTKIIGETCEPRPRWFTIILPAMIELARTFGIEIVLPDQLKALLTDIFTQRQQILESEQLVDNKRDSPLLIYLEALPPSYEISQENIIKHLSCDGSLFQSPSATASAFMATGNKNCLAYLQSISQRCVNGVPPTYPVDEDLVKLCVVNHLQRLGLAEHFIQEIKEVLAQVYWNYKDGESCAKPINSVATQLYKDSLAFQLFRMHGYRVSPWTFCWFLHNQEILDNIEKEPEQLSSVMINVHRATDLMFSEEYQLQEARSLARKLLRKNISQGIRGQDVHFTFSPFRKMIEHELDLSWFTRMEHLEHRMWIEENDMNALWMGKTSFHRLSNSHNEKLMQLAIQNYEFRQLIYRYELEELKRWSKDNGFSEMRFAREKTAYCYFAAAACITLPHDSYIRLMTAKSAILITVADDFFDIEGSLNELKNLTNAIKRWDDKGLSGHSKIIFQALDNFVREVVDKYLQLKEIGIIDDLRDIWYETFDSWLTEAKWSRSGCTPPINDYLETGMTSIATTTIVLPASYFLNPSLPNFKMKSGQYDILTKLLMVVARLLNDIQSYQKELKDGKLNFVLLYLKENPKASIEDSIAYLKQILATLEKELLEHALMDGFGFLPKSCKHLHLSWMKVFQMFFRSSNRYDSNTEMLDDIQKAIYIPLKVPLKFPTKKPLKPLPLCFPLSVPIHSSLKKKHQSIVNSHLNRSYFKCYSKKILATQQIPKIISKDGSKNMVTASKFFRMSLI